MKYRKQVLSLYRKALRIAKSWEEPSERSYIVSEAKNLVRRNKGIESEDVIAEKVHEFETRITTGLHYKIPYPRPTNVVPGATGKDPEVITPVYLDSYKQTQSVNRKAAREKPVS
ncbi:unnamed protein product [Agarophyton chilense]